MDDRLEEPIPRSTIGSAVGSALSAFLPSSLPLMARLSYRREVISSSLLPLMLGGLQGGTMAVFVKKTFDGVEGIGAQELNLAVGVVAASKALGHLTSFLWASISHGKPKVRFMMWLQIFTAAVIGLIAFAPRSPAGLWTVTGLCIVAWTSWSGVVTLRSGVWRANYHLSYRPRVAGKISTVQSLIIATVGAAVGFSLDWDSTTYRILFPTLAVVGAIGAVLYGRIPFRHERQHLRLERNAHPNSRPSPSPLAIAQILKNDRWYRGYMACTFLMGFGNLMLPPILVIVLTDQFDADYQTGIAIATVIPLLIMTFAIPFWSRMLERMHVIEFRAIHVWSFISVSALMLVGVTTNQIGFLYLAAVATGIAWGGGVLAWNLGHQHFAPRDRDAEYMGVHITLTGLRGTIGPLLGVLVYEWYAAFGAFLISLVMNVAGAIGFVLLTRKLHRHNAGAKEREIEDATEDQAAREPREHATSGVSSLAVVDAKN